MTEPRWSTVAGRVVSRSRAATGTLSVEGGTLHHRPTALERRLQAEDWSIDLADVTGFRVAPMSIRDAFSGGLRPRLALDAGRTTTHLFVVRDPKAIAKKLLQLAVEPVGETPADGPEG